MERKTTVILTSAVLLGALASIWFRLRPVTVRIDRTPIINAATGVGEALAEATAKAVQDRGRIVLVTDYDHERERDRVDIRWVMFQDALNRHGAISIAATEVVPEDPADGMPGCPRAAFANLLERYASVDAIVFFIDLPEWARVEPLLSPHIQPKIIGVDQAGGSLKARYRGYFERGILTALLGARSVPESTVEPKTPRTYFDKYYQVYTPQNYELLPD